MQSRAGTDDELITDAEHRRRVRERAAVDARWLDPTDEAEGIVPMCPEDEFNPVDGGGVMKVAAPANASRRVLSRKLVDFADRRDVYHRGFGVGKIVATTAAIEAHADDDDDGERLEISGNDENDDASSGDESDDGGCPSDDGGRTVGAEASEATDGNGAAAAADRAAGEEAG